ncbi:MAG: DUF1802 family protein [Elusimicrobia bacterium]|nr:DUF1802 family protein [Elusimicrobiota bacterium]
MKVALKEWAVVVQAIKLGCHHLLLRKGGLADKKQEFKLEQEKFFLFPTYEHQKIQLIQNKVHALYNETIKNFLLEDELLIECWAEVKEVFKISDLGILKQLEPYHVWSEEYLKIRLNYKPEKNLFLILLRTYQLKNPQRLKNLRRYSGCRSWIQLEDEISIDFSTPILSETDFKILNQNITSHYPK